MDCETCQAELLGFLYGESDDLRCAAVRRHVDGCSRCCDELERLTATRKLVREATDVEPPPELDAPVLAAAARLAADRRAAGPRGALAAAGAGSGSATTMPPGVSGPPWSRVVSWLGSMAMRPQVAMALLLVLMIGVGLWYLPQARRAAEWMRAEVAADHDDDGSGVTMVDDVDAGDARFDQHADSRRGGDKGRRWVRRDPAIKATPPTSRANASGAARPSDVVAARPRVDRASTDADAGTSETVADSRPTLDVESATVPAAPSSATAEATDEPAAFDEPIAANLYARAMNHYRAGRYGEAIDELGAVTRRTDAASLVPRAYLNLARSHRAAGNLPTAARTYETLLSRFPGFGQRAQAMWEAAVLYRRLGQLGRSRALLERLVEVPSHSTRARRELVMVNQGERAAAATTATDPAAAVEGAL